MPITPCFDPGTGASGGQVASGAATVLTVLDVDWAQLWIDNGSVNVDLSTSGTYTLGGTSFTVDQNHSGVTATLTSAGLRVLQTIGVAFDWSIALTANKASDIEDYVVLTADSSCSVSSRISGTNGSGVYAVGYTQAPTWGTTPGNTAIGAGIKVTNNSSQNFACVVRNVTAYNGTATQSPKINPTTVQNRWYATGTDYSGAYDTTAFGDTTLAPGTMTRTASTYSLPNTGLPYQHDYRAIAHPAVWMSGNTNLDFDITITRTRWLAWPTEG